MKQTLFTAVVQGFFPEDELPLMIANLHKKQEYLTQQSPASLYPTRRPI